MNTLNKYTGKIDGLSSLSAAEWNGAMGAIQDAITNLENRGGSGTSDGDASGFISSNAKGNVDLAVTGTNKKGSPAKLNIEACGDIQFKPGDDILLYSHHRGEDEEKESDKEKKKNEVAIKVMRKVDQPSGGDIDVPVTLQLNASEITLTTKDKPLTDEKKKDNEILDVNVRTGFKSESGQNTRGYLKVRARAIDLRCEEHGGIALQPKGNDGKGHMNKIKFEHGGGDGLEFGTFNTEKTSIYTDEYRFNKDGIWKMATRKTEASDKIDSHDDTTALKYVKQADDFYDIIDSSDATTTTKHIIKTANALNTSPGMKTTVSGKGNCSIAGSTYYTFVPVALNTDSPVVTKKGIYYDTGKTIYEKEDFFDPAKSYEKDDLKAVILDSTNKITLLDYADTDNVIKLPVGTTNLTYKIVSNKAPKVSISSETELSLEADGDHSDVVINASDCIKMEAPEIRLNAMNADKTGGALNLGATSEIKVLTSKFTKSGNKEAAGKDVSIILGMENNTSKTIYIDSDGIAHMAADVIAYDKEGNNKYNPAEHKSGIAIYSYDGKSYNLVPADTTLFVRTDDGKIYKVSTKGSEAVTSKSNTLIATIESGVYTRQSKKDSVYNPSLIVEDSTFNGNGDYTEILPKSDTDPTAGLYKEASVTLKDIALFVNQNIRKVDWMATVNLEFSQFCENILSDPNDYPENKELFKYIFKRVGSIFDPDTEQLFPATWQETDKGIRLNCMSCDPGSKVIKYIKCDIEIESQKMIWEKI